MESRMEAHPTTVVTRLRHRRLTVGMAAAELLSDLGVEGILANIADANDNNATFEWRKTLYATLLSADKAHCSELRTTWASPTSP